MITLQYLEPGAHIPKLSVKEVGEKLSSALALLPVDVVLLGWDIPTEFEDVCRGVASHLGTKIYRWHPLLTGDGTIYPKQEWRTRNLNGQPLSGFRNLPEFTFVCPNNPEARASILDHVNDLAQSSRYDGIFLDRMRFPSPAANLLNSLSCFCEHCKRAAVNVGLDLDEVRLSLMKIDKLSILRSLFGDKDQILSTFLKFRQQRITHFIQDVVSVIRAADLEVGLDCFSPSMTRMVGQDLSTLAPLADWTKIMVYGHAFGPATLPFEFADLANWLSESKTMSAKRALAELEKVTGVQLPGSLASLRNKGFTSETLAAEVARGRQLSGDCQSLAGIELVEMSGVSELDGFQIEADLRAIKEAGADGLSLSWDLWHMPLDRLAVVNSVWFS